MREFDVTLNSDESNIILTALRYYYENAEIFETDKDFAKETYNRLREISQKSLLEHLNIKI